MCCLLKSECSIRTCCSRRSDSREHRRVSSQTGSEDGDEETMNTLLGFQTHQAILDDSTWYERHLINLFDCLAYEDPKFKDVSAFQEWSYEKLTPVRILKDKIEKEAEATRNQVSSMQNMVKSLDFRVTVVPAKGKRTTSTSRVPRRIY